MPDTLPQSTETSLLQRLASAKEKASLEEEVLSFYDLFQTRLLRYAVSLGLKTQDAEDIIQEVFLALFRHLQLGRSRENLRGWIFRVTHNLALKRRIRYRREDLADEGGHDLLASSLTNPEEELLFSERQTRLRRAFSALPEADRLCLQLRAEGLKYREIADVLGISLGSVANSLGRSMSRLRRSDGESAG